MLKKKWQKQLKSAVCSALRENICCQFYLFNITSVLTYISKLLIYEYFIDVSRHIDEKHIFRSRGRREVGSVWKSFIFYLFAVKNIEKTRIKNMYVPLSCTQNTTACVVTVFRSFLNLDWIIWKNMTFIYSFPELLIFLICQLW